MRIVFFVNHFFPSVGGVQWSVLRTAEALVARGHDVTVFTETSASGGDSDMAYPFHLRRFRVPLRRPLTRLWYWHFMWSQRALFSSADILHFHDYTTFFHWFLPLRFLLRTPRYAVTFHGFEHIPILWRHRLLRGTTARLCDIRFAVGDYLCSFYRHPVDAVYIGAPVHPLLRQHVSARTHRRAASTALTVAYVGRLEEDTGILALLRCLRTAATHTRHPVSVRIAGDGKLRSAIEALDGDMMQVECLGEIQQPGPILDSADMAIASGFLAVFDAWQRALPVLAPAFGSMKQAYFESLPGMAQRLFRLDSEEQAVGIFSAILAGSKEEELTRVAERGQEFVSGLLWDDIALLLLTWYTEGGNRAAPRSQFAGAMPARRYAHSHQEAHRASIS
jgi:glycosyltransferase involved in cell wall biosynthesis